MVRTFEAQTLKGAILKLDMGRSLDATANNVDHEETKLETGGSDEQQDDCNV